MCERILTKRRSAAPEPLDMEWMEHTEEDETWNAIAQQRDTKREAHTS